MSDAPNRLALVARQAPYAQRSAREQLDVALAAAVLEIPLELYFLGDSGWQLASGRDPSAAGLPAGLKGWASLSGMTEVRFFVDQAFAEQLRVSQVETVVPLEHLAIDEMSRRWRDCARVLSL